MLSTGVAASDPPEVDLRRLPPSKRAIQVTAPEASLPIISFPPSARVTQDVLTAPIDPLLLASSLVSYFPPMVERWNDLSTKEAEDRLLLNAIRNVVNCATVVRKIRLDRVESVSSIPRHVLEIEADVEDFKERVERLKDDNKKIKGKANRARAARDDAEKKRMEAEDKLKDAVKTFKNGEEGRKFALEFATLNNANIISHLLGDPERRKRFLNLFEESDEGGLYRYRAIARGQYIGRCEEQGTIYGILSEKLGEPEAKKLKERLGFPEPYDPIPPLDETVFPPDPDAKRNEEEEDEDEVEGGSQGEEGRDAATRIGGDEAAAQG